MGGSKTECFPGEVKFMPVYTYRREDGSTFDVRQKFLDEPLTVDPDTGQKVVRVVQAPGIIFKGSGFYVNDSKDASKSAVNGPNGSSATPKSDTETKKEPETKKESETKKDSKPESKKEMAAAAD
jgi:putative FmdB family regulatory protein